MGQEQSSTNTENIVGQDDTSSLTPAEKALIVNQNEIFSCFFRNPTLENYNSIRTLRELYQKALGKKYDIFILAVRKENPSFHEPLDNIEDFFLRGEIQRLMSTESRLTAVDLDKIWILYYATGDKKYPERIVYISNDPKQHFAVKAAASWSYNSHYVEGKLA